MSNKQLEADVLAFLRRADQLLEQQQPTDDDGDDAQSHREEIIETVISQVYGHELSAACHVFASPTLQRVIAVAPDASLVALATPLLSARHVLTALTDKYGSHVIEALLAQVLPSLQRTNAAWQEGEASLGALAVSFADTLVADNAKILLAAMKDRYATHAMRSLFRVLAGLPPVSNQTTNTGGGPPGRKPPVTDDGAIERVMVPESFGAALGRIADAISALDGNDEYGGSALLEIAWHDEAAGEADVPATNGRLDAHRRRSASVRHARRGLVAAPPHEGAANG